MHACVALGWCLSHAFQGLLWVCFLHDVVREVRSGAHGVFNEIGEDMCAPTLWVKARCWIAAAPKPICTGYQLHVDQLVRRLVSAVGA